MSLFRQAVNASYPTFTVGLFERIMPVWFSKSSIDHTIDHTQNSTLSPIFLIICPRCFIALFTSSFICLILSSMTFLLKHTRFTAVTHQTVFVYTHLPYKHPSYLKYSLSHYIYLEPYLLNSSVNNLFKISFVCNICSLYKQCWHFR